MQKEKKKEFWVKLGAEFSVVQIFSYTDSLKIIVIVLFIYLFIYLLYFLFVNAWWYRFDESQICRT